MQRDELKNLIRDNIMTEMDFSRDVDDEEMLSRIDKSILKVTRTKNISLDEKLKLRKELYHSIRKLDVLQQLVDDPSITDARTLKIIQCKKDRCLKTACFRLNLFEGL